MDGVIGLSKTFWKYDGSKFSSLFLDSIFESGLISQKVFAIDLNYNNNFESSITFGGYDKTKILPGYNLTLL